MALDGGPAAPVRVQIAERRTIALDLRKQGGSYRKIAAQMRKMDTVSPKYSEAQAHNDVIAELHRLMDKNLEAADEIRQLEMVRFDELRSAIWQRAKAGDYAAIDRLIRISERISNMLGLDAPQKIEVKDWREEIRKVGVDVDTIFEQLVSAGVGNRSAEGGGGTGDTTPAQGTASSAMDSPVGGATTGDGVPGG